jgi:ribosomal protein S18 acetylase RimI-like enzyme
MRQVMQHMAQRSQTPASQQAPHIRFLADGDSADMDALIALYERALPASERRSSAVLRRQVRSPEYRIAVVKRDALAGFFVLFVGSGFGLLEYMAVDETCRGSGLGGELYRNARRELGGMPLLVEVEAVEPGGPEAAIRERRIAFYRRLGCRRLAGLRYLLPLGAAGLPPPMDLLVDGYAGDGVPVAQVRAWLEEIYGRVYDCAADDPRLALMLADVGDAIPLE